jgi:hypothetical protein
MRLSAVTFRPGTILPRVRCRSRTVKAGDGVVIEGSERCVSVIVDGVGQVYMPAAIESYVPALCSVCSKPLPPAAKGETCSKSCAAKLRHRRKRER